MLLEHEQLQQVRARIMAILGKHLDLNRYQVFFFGSRVAGRSREQSDIDVGILGPAPVPPLALSKINDELEDLPMLYKIDLVDFAAVSEPFKQLAMRQIEPINC